MDEVDLNGLYYALEDKSNKSLFGLTNAKIQEINYKILQELDLPENETNNLFQKLRGYKFVDELNDLKPGTFLRWISLIDDNPKVTLARGGIFCDTKITDNGIQLVVKNHYHKHYTLTFDDYFIFQKLTNQELILLSALDQIHQEEEL